LELWQVFETKTEMKLSVFQEHIRNLAILPQSESLVVSCYLTLDQGHVKDNRAYDQRIMDLRTAVDQRYLVELDQSLEWIQTFLEKKLKINSNGIAIFARAGEKKFFLPLEFEASLPNLIFVDTVPDIYHLIEMKETFHRYVVMICSEKFVRIVGLNFGKVTENLWHERPELQKRVGREWSREHYQDHRKNNLHKFIREKIKILEDLISSNGYSKLVLAGKPEMTAYVRSILPKHIAGKLIDVIRLSAEAKPQDIIDTTIESFIEQEQRESNSLVELLMKEIRTDGLGVIGTASSLRRLYWGQVDILLLADDYKPQLGLVCENCRKLKLSGDRSTICSRCSNGKLIEFNIKEEMVRLAARNGSTVEVIRMNQTLSEVGGVGCLLRYRIPDMDVSNRELHNWSMSV